MKGVESGLSGYKVSSPIYGDDLDSKCMGFEVPAEIYQDFRGADLHLAYWDRQNSQSSNGVRSPQNYNYRKILARALALILSAWLLAEAYIHREEIKNFDLDKFLSKKNNDVLEWYETPGGEWRKDIRSALEGVGIGSPRAKSSLQRTYELLIDKKNGITRFVFLEKMKGGVHNKIDDDKFKAKVLSSILFGRKYDAALMVKVKNKLIKPLLDPSLSYSLPSKMSAIEKKILQSKSQQEKYKLMLERYKIFDEYNINQIALNIVEILERHPTYKSGDKQGQKMSKEDINNDPKLFDKESFQALMNINKLLEDRAVENFLFAYVTHKDLRLPKLSKKQEDKGLHSFIVSVGASIEDYQRLRSLHPSAMKRLQESKFHMKVFSKLDFERLKLFYRVAQGLRPNSVRVDNKTGVVTKNYRGTFPAARTFIDSVAD